MYSDQLLILTNICQWFSTTPCGLCDCEWNRDFFGYDYYSGKVTHDPILGGSGLGCGGGMGRKNVNISCLWWFPLFILVEYPCNRVHYRYSHKSVMEDKRGWIGIGLLRIVLPFHEAFTPDTKPAITPSPLSYHVTITICFLTESTAFRRTHVELKQLYIHLLEHK